MASVRVCAVDDLAENQASRFVIDGVPIAVVKDSAGEIFAIGDTCTHGDISLAEGFVEDDTLECWAHGSKFSLVTGKPLTLPAYEPVPVFRVEAQGRRRPHRSLGHPDRLNQLPAARPIHRKRLHTNMSVLEIKNLHVNVETDQGTREILRGVDLVINEGEIHAVMGPNGSGKSTLAYTIAGHPKYQVVNGEILLDGENVLEMTVDARARAGLFLAMQYPVEIPGVTVTNFLRTAKTAIDGEAPSIRTWVKDVRESMSNLRMDSNFAERNVNEGFSGGEKKRNEILQLELLKPRFAVLDETDSGLDVDALKIVSEGVNRAHAGTGLGILLITHYTRILRYIKPDFVHVFVAGRIAEQGGPELADRLEEEGYDRYQVAEPAAAE